MKITITLIALIHLCLIGAAAQTGDQNELNRLNVETVEKFKNGDHKAAQKTAEAALKLSIELNGLGDSKTADAFYNLAQIHKVRENHGAAIFNYKKALEIYQQHAEQFEERIIKLYDSLVASLAVDSKKAEAEEYLVKLLEAAENKYGTQSKELLKYRTAARDFYLYTKQTEKAEEFFVSVLKSSAEIYGTESPEVEKVLSDFDFFAMSFPGDEGFQKKLEFRRILPGKLPAPEDGSGAKTINGGVINGKAISLARPDFPYPPRYRGYVSVQVLIDENGRVVNAKAVSKGDPIIAQACEDAAMRSRFQPTELNGQKVKVSGIITYAF